MALQLNGTDGVTFNDGSEQWAAASPIGTKNLIINGDMRIAQRGTSVSGITSNGYKTIDRFFFGYTTQGTWTNTQSTDTPTGQGFANSYKLECTTADASPANGDGINIQHRFEGQNLQHIKKGTSNAESVTLSFWVKSNKTGTYIAELFDADNTRQISKAYTINTADTWEKKTITFVGDTTGAFDNDNALSLYLLFWLGAGSDFTSGTLNTSWASNVNANRAVGQVNLADSTSNYINITGVQLEVGDTATPFEHRPYDMELARCMRYYEHSYSGATNSGLAGMIVTTVPAVSNAYIPIQFKVAKRANPTMLSYDTSNNVGKITTPSGSNQSPFSFERIGFMSCQLTTSTISSAGSVWVGWSAESEL